MLFSVVQYCTSWCYIPWKLKIGCTEHSVRMDDELRSGHMFWMFKTYVLNGSKLRSRLIRIYVDVYFSRELHIQMQLSESVWTLQTFNHNRIAAYSNKTCWKCIMLYIMESKCSRRCSRDLMVVSRDLGFDHSRPMSWTIISWFLTEWYACHVQDFGSDLKT